MDFLVRQKALEKKVQDMGFDQFSAEELSSFEQEAQKPLGRDPQPVRGLHPERGHGGSQGGSHEAGGGLLRRPGPDPEDLLKAVKNNASQDKMTDYLMGGYQPTEEEILEVFNQVGPPIRSSMRTTSPPTST